MFTNDQVLALALGLVAGTAHLHGAVLGLMLLRTSRELPRLFAATFLTTAWYSVWVGVRHSGLFDAVPILHGTPMLFAGFLGPLLYLFTRKLLHPFDALGLGRYWVLALGLPGTFVFFYILFHPDPMMVIRAANAGRISEYPVALVAFASNGVEILGCVLAAAWVAGRAFWGKDATPGDRQRAGWALGPIAAAVFAVLVSNVLPAIGAGFKASMFGPILTLPMMFLALAAVRHAGGERAALEAQRKVMSRYLPREIVERIVVGRHRLDLGGDMAVATILISDIRGFTAMSERLPPEQVVAGLNRYLSTMTDVVFQHGGMVDKFIGDSILAVFGVPEGDGHDAEKALACARDMLDALETFNREWTSEGHPPFAIGIGLHRGPVVHGNVGSENRMDFTVIGDTVNTASRVESLTKELGAVVLLTRDVAEAVPPMDCEKLESRGEHVLRGRVGATEILSLRAPDAAPA